MTIADVVKEQKRTIKMFHKIKVSSQRDLLMMKLETLFKLEEIMMELIK